MASTQITGQSGLAFLPYGVSPGTRAADPLVAQPSVASPGVSTQKRLRSGSKVEKFGIEYTVGRVDMRGVVTLNDAFGNFAMYSHKSVCKVIA